MSTKLREKMTIVIPAKNEEDYIEGILTDIVSQENIRGVKVFVADGSSEDTTRKKVLRLKELYAKEISIELIEGGNVSKGRNAGLARVETPYVIFIDADVRLSSTSQIYDTYRCLLKKTLVGAKLRTHSSFLSSAVYSAFNFFNLMICKKRPFALGSYFATRSSKIKDLGGWDESLVHSEDWELSGKYSPKDYKLCKYPILVDDRRFKRMGYFAMGKMLFLNLLIGREYRKKDNGYWN
jgi:glycosyltransferase involved in cell wall biosynthesis